MKNRYSKIDNGDHYIITGRDNSYTAPLWCETDDNLSPIANENDVHIWKEMKSSPNIIVLRTQSEIESDPIYIEKYNAGIKQKLNDIDLKSVRSMREYISSKSDAPQFIKDHEAEAKAERDKLK